MAISLVHTTAAAGTDSGDGKVSKNAWNEAHTLTLATDKLLGRDTAGTGAVEEIGAGTGLEFDGAGNIRLADNGVSLAKLADIATDRLLGRDTAATGDPEALTVGGGIEFTGSGGIQRSALTGDVTATAGSSATTIANDAVTYAKLQDVSATDRLLGRDTAAAGIVEELTVGGGVEFTGSGGLQRSALTGDVTATAGSNATTIANDAVSNAKAANMAASTIKGNNTGSTGDPVDMTVAQTLALLGLPTRVQKTSNENRSSANTGATLTVDSTLKVTLAAGVWFIRVVAYFSTANATMDYKYDTNFTGTGTFNTRFHRHVTAGAAAGTDNETDTPGTGTVPSTAVTATTSGEARVEVELVLDVSVSGDFQFRWAQNTADAGNLTCRRGSYLEYMAS